jgi:ferrous iron transport protein B
VALAGQPNVGKSTVFNILTGLNQHVGNWPGKTVERREGTARHSGTTYRLVDLPGTYSLTANSAEEIVAREYIIRDRPDVVVAVVNAAALERSLYLVAELVCLPAPVVVALNMMDVAEGEGMLIEPDVLAAALGVPVVPMVASKAIGVHELLDEIDDVLCGRRTYEPKLPHVRADHQAVLERLEDLVAEFVPSPYPAEWVSLKLLEGDEEITTMMADATPDSRWAEVRGELRAHDDALVAVAGGRYEWIGRMIRAAVTHPRPGQIGLTERLDRWFTHPVWGLLVLAAILGLAFWLTYAVGTPLVDVLDRFVSSLAETVRAGLSWAPAWVPGLVADGVIGGMSFVVTFLPILLIFFAVLATLEDVGYMARGAYVMDGFMHLMGLHGKSFLPLFLGFGCNVPAVLGARVVGSRRARLLTIFLAPLIPCAARMAVVAFLAPVFVGRAAALVSWGLILLALGILATTGVVVNRALFRGQRAAFIMELPLYHLPNPRTIGLLVWQRSLEFVRKAITVILPVAILIWALSVLPTGDVESSYLAGLGRLLEPLGRTVGFDWRLIVALLTSFIAKENSVATLGVLYGASEGAGLAQSLAKAIPVSTGLAFLTFQMLFIPCVATVAAIRQETRSWRWTLANVAFLLVVSWAASAAIFWLSRLAGL